MLAQRCTKGTVKVTEPVASVFLPGKTDTIHRCISAMIAYPLQPKALGCQCLSHSHDTNRLLSEVNCNPDNHLCTTPSTNY